MKTKKKPTKQASETVTLYPRATHDEANEKFLQSLRKPRDGENQAPAECFLRALQYVVCKPSFTFTDILNSCRPYNLGTIQVRELFTQWCDVQFSLNKLTRIPPLIADEDTFILN